MAPYRIGPDDGDENDDDGESHFMGHQTRTMMALKKKNQDRENIPPGPDDDGDDE